MSKDLFSKQTNIMNLFGGNYVKLGKTFYTDAQNSLKLIDYCEKYNMIILGIETFKLNITDIISIQPNMEDDIYYFEKYVKNADGNYHWNVAKQFIKDKMIKNLLFEVDFDISEYSE